MSLKDLAALDHFLRQFQVSKKYYFNITSYENFIAPSICEVAGNYSQKKRALL